MAESAPPAPAVVPGEPETSLRDVFAVLFRGKWVILGFFVLVVSLVTLGTYVAAELYESEAKLLIKIGRENVAADPTIVGPTINLSQNRENDVNSEVGILESRFLAEQVVDTFGPEAFLSRPDERASDDPQQESLREIRRTVREQERWFHEFLIAIDIVSRVTPREKAIDELTRNLKIDADRDSAIINVALRARSPTLAHDALEKMIESYLEQHIRVHRAQASPDFFETQTRKLRVALLEREDQLERFRAENSIASIEREKDGLLDLVGTLEAELDVVDTQLASVTAKVATLEKSLVGRPRAIEINRTTGRSNLTAGAFKERLVDLQLKYASLAALYPDDHRLLRDLRRQVRLAEEALAGERETLTEVTVGIDANYQSVQLVLETERAQLESHLSRRETLRTLLAVRKRELGALAARELELGRLERDVEIAEKEYRQYRENLQRAQINEALDIDKVSNVSVVQPPTLAFEPVRPRKLLNIAAGIVLGLFGGVALAFLVSMLDDSLNTADDVRRRLRLPVLLSLSEEEYARCT